MNSGPGRCRPVTVSGLARYPWHWQKAGKPFAGSFWLLCGEGLSRASRSLHARIGHMSVPLFLFLFT